MKFLLTLCFLTAFALLSFGAGEATRKAQPRKNPVLPRPAEAKPGFPHVVPRLAQPASGDRSFKTGGERRPAFLSPPARRPGPLHGHL